MSFFGLFLVGILIGTAMIIPGVSGGVLAVVFNVYDKMIYSLINLFKEFKKNFTFLFILGSGIVLGAIWFSKIIIFLYDNHEVLTKFSFIGLILGGVPYLFYEVRKNTGKNVNYVAMIITFLISLFLWFLSSNVLKIDLDRESSSIIISFLNLFIAGIVYSIGKVIPGISGSFLLILIGMYEYVLGILSNPFSITSSDVCKLIPFVLGLILGVVVLLKFISYLLENNFRLTYSIIIGFVIGSIWVLIPNLKNVNIFSSLAVLLISFLLSYKLSSK